MPAAFATSERDRSVFVGLSERETAEVLGCSERTIERHWAYAQAWLFDRIRRDEQF